jgi:hypothetical protein
MSNVLEVLHVPGDRMCTVYNTVICSFRDEMDVGK